MKTNLLSLSYDALLDILPFLEAASLGRLACVSRLFNLLVKEQRHHQPLFFTTRGTKDQVKAAIKADIPCRPSLGLLFRQSSWSDRDVMDLLPSLPKDMELIGSSTSDVICVPKVGGFARQAIIIHEHIL